MHKKEGGGNIYKVNLPNFTHTLFVTGSKFKFTQKISFLTVHQRWFPETPTVKLLKLLNSIDVS